MEAPKPEEISHPAMDQLQGLEYCIDSNPSWAEAIALGFQHYILALGTAVMIPTFLVPFMGGDDGDKVRVVQTLLFIQGINTLLQTLFGTRLPTVIGGSYAFMVPIISIIHDSRLMKVEDNHAVQILSLNQQASLDNLLYFIFNEGIYISPYRFFSPLGMVPVISLVGFGLFDRGFPLVGKCVEIGIPMLILFVAFSQYLKNFHARQLPVLERFALLISITVIWAYAHLLTASGAYKHRPDITQVNCRTDRANLISSAPWIKIPYPLQWGAPTFDVGHAFGMMAAVLVSLIESTGAYKAASRLASATIPPAHVLSRGIGWQGIGILLNGLFGTLSGSTVSMGYTLKAFHGPAHTNAGWFNDFLNTIFSSSPTVALIVAVFLDNTLEYKDSARDRGMPWWVKFRQFKGDSRNEEFYTLPFNLNRFFPPS
ncbi:hypothetical protein DVH24_017355 [Malus domestica]|uniref:Nucleobase-ascorbate transporter 2 n=1 Tax=Malus domestica TaxID=3750 RepID=A0A498IX79_MALDO|nr:hypothetical protein DVH24_017355 [Malus domestica]